MTYRSHGPHRVHFAHIINARFAVALLVSMVGAAGVSACADVSTNSSAGEIRPDLPIATAASDNEPPTTDLGDLLRSSGGTYIDRILADRDSVLDRWADRVASPIRVWIDPAPPQYGAAFVPAVRAAFDQWAATGIPVRFQFVTNPGDAEVKVHWELRPGQRTGNTVWKVDGHGWMHGADIALSPRLSDGRPLDATAMHSIALHETGHMLGLAHSRDPHDVMYPIVQVSSLSGRDVATIRLLYSLQAGRVR